MSLPALTFECYQLESGVWCKRRANGLRGACVADEAILWQHLQAAQAAPGQKPPPQVDIELLVRENEQLHREANDLRRSCEDWQRENERLTKDCERLASDHHLYAQRVGEEMALLRRENDALRANQRQKPGRKPRRSDAAGAEDQALAAPEQEQDPLDEDL